MQVEEALVKRRAVKHYDASHQLTADEENRLFTSMLQSPTAFNIQNWRFVVVKDKQLRQKIRQAAWDQSQVTDASMLVIFCADLMSWQKQPERYWRYAPEEVQQFLLPAIDGYYRDKEQVMRDEAMRSCGIAAQSLMLVATAMGYESCPMDGFDYEQVGKLINLPSDHVISLMVVVGKGVKSAWPKPGQLDANEVIIQDGW